MFVAEGRVRWRCAFFCGLGTFPDHRHWDSWAPGNYPRRGWCWDFPSPPPPPPHTHTTTTTSPKSHLPLPPFRLRLYEINTSPRRTATGLSEDVERHPPDYAVCRCSPSTPCLPVCPVSGEGLEERVHGHLQRSGAGQTGAQRNRGGQHGIERRDSTWRSEELGGNSCSKTSHAVLNKRMEGWELLTSHEALRRNYINSIISHISPVVDLSAGGTQTDE